MRTKFPRLCRLLHLLGVHTLIDHAGNLDIAAKGQPADGVGGVTVLGLPLKWREPWVEEETKLLYSYLEELGKEEVSPLVEHDEQGEAEDELKRTYNKCFHGRTLGFVMEIVDELMDCFTVYGLMRACASRRA